MRLSVSFLWLTSLVFDWTVGEECGLYLAPSSTSTLEEPKWGIFTGEDIPKGAMVGSPEIAVQAFNFQGHTRGKEGAVETNDIEMTRKTAEIFEQYVWVPDATGGKFEVEDGKTVTAITGPGVLGGFNARLTNAEWNHGGAYFRTSLNEYPQDPHPGRGSYSNFYNVTLVARNPIQQGSEIFMDYGENWEDEASEEELTQEDYDRVDTFVDQMIEFFGKHDSELTPTSRIEIYEFLTKDVMNAAAGASKGKTIAQILPADPSDLPEIKANGGAMHHAQPKVRRTTEWLKENGLCMDNLEAGPSTIRHAGRGAFAKRPIAAGKLVVPIPLIHIPFKKALDMYDLNAGINEEGEQYWYREASQSPRGVQLLTNYVFGHPESSMVFFPSGSQSALINHSREKVNAKLVWSKHNKHQPEWFEASPSDFLDGEHLHLGLVMEVVATKDIAVGGEIFLDYGNEWLEAWENHLVSWKAKLETKELVDPWPLRAIDLAQEYKRKPFEVNQDLPQNIRQMCFLVVEEEEEESEESDLVKNWVKPPKGSPFDAENLFDCVIKARKEARTGYMGLPYNYTVTWTSEDEETTTIQNVPHQAIILVDAPGTSDQFVEGAFRHPIGIPDDIFPEAWKDLKK